MATNPRSKVMEVISRVLPRLSTVTTSNNSTSMAATSMVTISITNNTALPPTVDSNMASTVELSMVDQPRHNTKHTGNTHLAILLTSSLNKELTTRTPHLKTLTTLTPTSKTSMAPPILLQAKRAIVVLWEQWPAASAVACLDTRLVMASSERLPAPS